MGWQHHRSEIHQWIHLLPWQCTSAHWATKKQNCVSASSFESEYIALSHAARETALMKRRAESIMELAIPAEVLCDNQAAETVAKGGDGYVRWWICIPRRQTHRPPVSYSQGDGVK